MVGLAGGEHGEDDIAAAWGEADQCGVASSAFEPTYTFTYSGVASCTIPFLIPVSS